MARWLLLLLLLAPCSGCMMMEDMLGYEEPAPWVDYASAQQPGGTCGQPIRNVSALQTAEPELLR
ncbi:MAG: hypothetical protein HYX68_20645 [Planctomycetes bacterium]|nr:hypothetical protein [Planctomycetota bacterium]